MVLLQALDCATTLCILGHHGAKELNPFIDHILNLPWGTLWFILLKVVGLGAASVWLWNRKRPWAIWTVISIYSLVVLWNLSLVAFVLFVV